MSLFEHEPVPHKDPSEEEWNGWHLIFTENDRWNYRDAFGSEEISPRKAVFGSPQRLYQCRHDQEIPSDRCLDIEFRGPLIKQVSLFEEGFSRSVIRVTPRMSMLKETLKRQAQGGFEDEEIRETAETLVFELFRSIRKPEPSFPPVPISRPSEIAQAVQEYIQTHWHEKVSLADLSASAGLSRFHFIRVFKSATGQTPYGFLLRVRMKKAAEHLLETSLPVTTIAFESGFQDLSLFIQYFRRTFGLTPLKFRLLKEKKTE
jgi:AraC-like DNA-binding protein